MECFPSCCFHCSFGLLDSDGPKAVMSESSRWAPKPVLCRVINVSNLKLPMYFRPFKGVTIPFITIVYDSTGPTLYECFCSIPSGCWDVQLNNFES